MIRDSWCFIFMHCIWKATSCAYVLIRWKAVGFRIDSGGHRSSQNFSRYCTYNVHMWHISGPNETHLQRLQAQDFKKFSEWTPVL